MCKADSNLNNDNDMDMLENMLADPLTSMQLEEKVNAMSVKPISVKPTVRPMPQVRKLKPSVPKPQVRKLKPSAPKPQTKKPKTETESWSIADFEEKRKELVEFVCDNICPLIENGTRRILVRAPVKSGKRGMVEYLAMRDKKSRENRVHAFVSAWHRAADKEQREELGDHNLKVISIISEKSVKSFLKWLEDNIEAGNLVVVHLDECDHGSGETQMLSKIWPKIRSDPRVTTILYSATPEEAMFSPEFKEFLESHPPLFYTPPKGYCGSGRFLEEGLVHDARPFFTKDGLTEQAKEILRDMQAARQTNPKRNIFILRLTGVNSKHDFLENLRFFKELSEFTLILDKEDDCNSQKEDIQWSSKSYWDTKGTDKPILIVHNQTATRSTEWSCHDRVFATHDYREKVSYVVVSQAQERVNHYEAKYGGFQPIRVYGHKKTFLLSAGKIDHKEYMRIPWTKHKLHKIDAYVIRRPDTKAIHPLYKAQYSEEKANEILRSMDSLTAPIVSNRTKGTVEDEEVVECFFVPCNKDDDINGLVQKEFKRLKFDPKRTFDNEKFINSEKKGMVRGLYQGNFRVWKVFDYQEVLKEKNAGLDEKTTIRSVVCYNEGVLGLGFRYLTGKTEEKTTLKSNLSMFK